MIWATTKRICAFLVDLFFPRTCAICRMRLGEHEHCVCMECALTLPRYCPSYVRAEERLLGSPLIRSLSAPFIYQHGNPTYELIIALKYRGYGEVADFVVRTALTAWYTIVACQSLSEECRLVISSPLQPSAFDRHREDEVNIPRLW